MLRKLLLGLALVLVLAVGVGFTMPSTWKVERTVVVLAPAATVFLLVNDLRRWPEWTTWSERSDPSLRREFAGGPAGVGAAMSWRGDEVGVGHLKISASDPARGVGYDLELERDAFSAPGRIDLAPAPGGVRVTWSTGGELGMNPLARLMGPWIEAAVGDDFETGLAGLKRVAEGRG